MRQGGSSRFQHHPSEVLRQVYPVSSFLWHFPGGQKFCFWVEENIVRLAWCLCDRLTLAT